MDIQALVNTALQTLRDEAVKAGTLTALKEGSKTLWTWVKDLLFETEPGKEAVAAVDAQVDDELNWDVLSVEVRKALRADPERAEELQRLLAGAESSVKQEMKNTGEGSTNVQTAGEKNKITIQR